MAKYFPNENTFIGHCNLIQKYLKKNYTTMSPSVAIDSLQKLNNIRKETVEKYLLPGYFTTWAGTPHTYTGFRIDTVDDDLQNLILQNENLFKRMSAFEETLKIPIVYNVWEVKRWFMINIIGCDKDKYNIAEFYNDLMK